MGSVIIFSLAAPISRHHKLSSGSFVPPALQNSPLRLVPSSPQRNRIILRHIGIVIVSVLLKLPSTTCLVKDFFAAVPQLPGHPIRRYKLVHSWPRWRGRLALVKSGAGDSLSYTKSKLCQLEAGVAHGTALLVPDSLPSTLVAAVSSQVSVMSPTAYQSVALLCGTFHTLLEHWCRSSCYVSGLYEQPQRYPLGCII